MSADGPTAAAALPKMYRYVRPPTRTVIGTTRCPRGWMANVVGVKPMRWSTRLGMTELKKVSSTALCGGRGGREQEGGNE